MEAVSRLPCLEAHTSHGFARSAGRGERQATAVAAHDMPARHEAGDPHLQPLDRGIDVAHGTSGGAFLAEDVPGLERLTQLERHTALLHRAADGKAKGALRLEPARLEGIAGPVEVGNHT